MDIERYGRARQIDLGISLLQRRKIFLDARFWILLRDADQGVRSEPNLRKLLHALRKGVRSGSLVCPLSASMFMELMKQPFTPSRRRVTAKLIDELSLGVSSIPPQEVAGTEISHFLLGMTSKALLHPMQELIWTKVGYSLGITYPVLAGVEARDEQQIQRAFFDYLWDRPLIELVDATAELKPPSDGFQKLSIETNEKNLLHRDELKSFEAAYDIELRGAVEAVGEAGADVLEDIARRSDPDGVGRTQERRSSVNLAKNVLYHAIKGGRGRDVLRTLHVAASLHAAMRWDKHRKFKANDYYDLEHATIALGYCDALFTEKPLHALVTSQKVRLDAVNSCTVVSDVSQAIECVASLRERPPHHATVSD